MSFAISALATGAAAFHMPLSAAPHSAGLAAVRMQELASLGAPPMQQTGAQGQVVRTKGPARRLSSPPARRAAILVQGGSLRTWSYRSPAIDQVQVSFFSLSHQCAALTANRSTRSHTPLSWHAWRGGLSSTRSSSPRTSSAPSPS